VLITAIPPIALTVGANRIVRGIAIPHPVGDPKEEPESELGLRKELLKKALEALSTPIAEQTLFS
jgi:glycine reductase